MDWAYLLNGFHGRIGRKTFWIAMGVLTLAELVGHFTAEQIEGDRLSAIVDLAFTYPEFAVAVKRAHDRDMPVWLLRLFSAQRSARPCSPSLGWSGNADEPSMLSLAIAVPFTVFGLALLVELGFRRGHGGPQSIRARSAGRALTSGRCSAEIGSMLQSPQ